MRHFIVASHGRLAEGMMDAVRIIMGDIENIRVYGAYIHPEEELEDEVEKLVNSYPLTDEVIVITDILGGSVCNAFVRRLNRENLHIIAGMNLGMLLEVLVNREKPLEELMEIAIHGGKCGVCYCNKMLEEVNEEDI